MSRNGSGTYNLPAGNPVVTGATIQSSWANATLTDIAAALTQSYSRDGQAAMTGPVPMGGQDLQNGGNINGATFIPSGAAAPANGMYLPAANTVGIASATALRWSVNSTGNHTFAAPTAGITVTINGLAGTHSIKISDAATNLFNAGYLELPINGQASPYTAVLSDSGKALYFSAAGASAFTIPSNAAVPYPIGTVLTFINDASTNANMTIAITADTLVLAGVGTTGSRQLAQFGEATAVKVAATRWYISGPGLS
jgi:hypothetical protein